MPRPTKDQPNLKDLILQVLRTKHHASVQEIGAVLKNQGYSYNKTSLYRALDSLLTAGVICKQLLTETKALYELREHHHAHVVCENCGAYTTTECEYSHPKTVDGFSISHHHVTLLGLCQTCAVA